MRARRHAQHAHRRAEGERYHITERAPLRRHDRSWRQGPERSRWLSGRERAILRTIAARVPPCTEMLVPAELGDVDRARAPPMLLEPEIDQHAGGERERNEHQHDRAAGKEQ